MKNFFPRFFIALINSICVVLRGSHPDSSRPRPSWIFNSGWRAGAIKMLRTLERMAWSERDSHQRESIGWRIVSMPSDLCALCPRDSIAVGFPFEPPQLDECSICEKTRFRIFMMTSTVLCPVFVRPPSSVAQKSVRFEIIHIHNNFSCPRPCLLRIHSSPDHQADRKHNFFSRAVITNCFFASFSHFDCSSSRFIIRSHQRGAQSGN